MLTPVLMTKAAAYGLQKSAEDIMNKIEDVGGGLQIKI